MAGETEKANVLLSAKLVALGVAMFAFAIFVMPPLYDVFCEITGLNGKTGAQYQAREITVDTSREITVQFVATNNEAMPWVFEPGVKSIKVHPGQPVDVIYRAVNPTNRDMVAQAVPSLVPFKAAQFFHKTECFCFNNQPLKAGETAELGLQFIVDLDVPKQVNTITLSYTLFDITDATEAKVAGNNRAQTP
ncbi:cytochrome c oxidase assembly protein [Simiduia aestuariiviva]|uniref:Cytochrome c oxidase assembly protein CtaG n=1 Tax=Simiduia aestuariiviva TaxID=1510459 RepID=A0A839UNM8_9GAMM|nr:cytochrome c oxidase assembly protein [Simiduia aestuariiviva]MBB3169794.1 cytochrome c oxidase assembly protein subunit 11 [Simiduia aestuariiviva]